VLENENAFLKALLTCLFHAAAFRVLLVNTIGEIASDDLSKPFPAIETELSTVSASRPAYMAYASLPLNAMPRKWFLILAYGYAVMSLYLLA
jgi:hypothetical protein